MPQEPRQQNSKLPASKPTPASAAPETCHVPTPGSSGKSHTEPRTGVAGGSVTSPLTGASAVGSPGAGSPADGPQSSPGFEANSGATRTRTEQLAREARNEGQRLRQDTERAAAETKESTRAKASEFTDRAKQQVQSAADNVREGGRRAADRALEQGSAMFNAQRQRAADELTHFSSAMRRAADELHSDDDHRIAEFAEMAADQVDEAANYMQRREPSAMLNDFEAMARRRPEIVFGGLFIAGLGISRFLKATARR